jgi:TRAP-type uncharacterized transport system fused permease subunit
MIVYRPQLMMIGSVGEIILVAVLTTIGALALVAVVQGYLYRPCKLYERFLLLVSCGLLLIPPLHAGWTTIGLVIAGVVLVPQVVARRRERIGRAVTG